LVNDQRDAQILFYVFICSFTKNHYMMDGQKNVKLFAKPNLQYDLQLVRFTNNFGCEINFNIFSPIA